MPETAYMDTNTNYVLSNTLIKLAQMANLKSNWNGYGADPLPYDTLYKAQRLIPALHVQPEIFPTANGSIQIEYEKDNGDYLELQFSGKGTCEVFRIIDDNEEYFTSPDNVSSINTIVDSFYGYQL